MDLPLTHWIWLPDFREEVRGMPVFGLFRKALYLDVAPETMKIKISADTRYKLYVNGVFVEYGPARGDGKIWYYDVVDIAPWLCPGENVVAVMVLRYPIASRLGNFGMLRTDTPGLYVEELSKRTNKLVTDETWRCIQSRLRTIRPELRGMDGILMNEEWTCDPALQGWTMPAYSDQAWDKAKAYHIFQITGMSPLSNMTPRQIPFMKRTNRRFPGLVPKYSNEQRSAWDAMLAGEGAVEIPPNTHTVIQIDAGEEMTAFLSLRLHGGKGTRIQLMCAESYYTGEEFLLAGSSIKKKGNRTDCSGYLDGFVDILHVSGCPEGETWEPFWYRTFRFVQLEIQTGSEALTITGFDYQETGYPIEVKTRASASDPDFFGIWDISLRTLKRCMQETYMDCPYYEQLQYIMDTRSEILYTYCVSGDDRLARQALDDFRRGQRANGLLNCCYPYSGEGVIPGFSVYYILILHDHMMYFGDSALIRYHLGTVDEILNYFETNLDEQGLVRKIGGTLSDSVWSFIDWSTAWGETQGMPPAGLTGPITMESMLYVYGLQKAAELCDYVGRSDTAREYRNRSRKVQEAIDQYCRGEDGVYLDGPGVFQYSQHTQVFAVLTGMLDPKQGKTVLLQTMREPEKYAQCSVAFMFYLFRALEKTGAYDATASLWDVWRRMLHNHLTTCVENNTDERSDCHAWGAVLLYELPAVILGVRPGAPGYETIEISPNPGYLSWAQGDVVTLWGVVHVQWKTLGDGTLDISVDAPENAKHRLRIRENREEHNGKADR